MHHDDPDQEAHAVLTIKTAFSGQERIVIRRRSGSGLAWWLVVSLRSQHLFSSISPPRLASAGSMMLYLVCFFQRKNCGTSGR